MDYIIPPTKYPELTTKAPMAFPLFELPDGFIDMDCYLEYLTFQGATRIYGNTLPECVADRVRHELDIIKQKGFATYFLIIEDVVRVARERFNMFIGHSLGSPARSLVCYCLGITTVNPLKYDLPFESFLSLDRDGLPYIDIDCKIGSREVIISYLKERYGDLCVTRVIHYIRNKEEPSDIIDYAIEANMIALSLFQTSDYSPLTMVGNEIVTIYDRWNIEKAGPVLINIIEYPRLNMIHEIQDLIYKHKHIDVDVSNISTDDESVLRAFSRGQTKVIDIFSLPEINDCLMSISDLSFDDLIALFSLHMSNKTDLFPEYVSRRNGKVQASYPLPIMEQCLKTTYGMIIYEEQIMELVRLIANFSRAESNECKKAILKLKKNKLEHFYQKFIDGGLANGYSFDILETIWNDLSSHWWVSVKSSAVCRAKGACQVMYLKVCYPDEFYEVVFG